MEESTQAAKQIAFEFMKYMSSSGMKLERCIWFGHWRNELIDISASKLAIKVDEQLRYMVEQELKQAWKVIVSRY